MISLFSKFASLPRSDRNPQGRNVLHYIHHTGSDSYIKSQVIKTYCGIEDVGADLEESRKKSLSFCQACIKPKAACLDAASIINEIFKTPKEDFFKKDFNYINGSIKNYFSEIITIPLVESAVEDLISIYPKDIQYIDIGNAKFSFNRFAKEFNFNRNEKEIFFVHRPVKVNGKTNYIISQGSVCGVVTWKKREGFFNSLRYVPPLTDDSSKNDSILTDSQKIGFFLSKKTIHKFTESTYEFLGLRRYSTHYSWYTDFDYREKNVYKTLFSEFLFEIEPESVKEIRKIMFNDDVRISMLPTAEYHKPNNNQLSSYRDEEFYIPNFK